jgi:hypothetical protein
MKAVFVALSVACGISARAAEPILGFNYPIWSRDGYEAAPAQKDLSELAATGAGWVALTPTLYMKDVHDSAIMATANTPTEKSLRSAIRRAHALNLKVALKPHIDSLDNLWRMNIAPKDPEAWFSNYRAYLLDYARIAREEHCELFVVGTELALLSLPPHWEDWRRLIAAVRGEYHGPLTYAAIAGSAETVGFWRDLDYIGVDGYYPMIGGTDRRLLRLSWIPIMAALHALSAANGRPILFTEFGVASEKGANLKPWDYREFGPVDLDVQAAYVQTFLDAFSTKSYVAGFLNWSWDGDPAHSGPNDKSMSLRGKPALEAFTGLIRASAAASRPVPDHAPVAARAVAMMDAASFP